MSIDDEAMKYVEVRQKLALPITPDLDRLHLRAAERRVTSESERFMRDLLGDEVYETWSND